MKYWCDRYNMSCEEALYCKCDVPSTNNYINTEEECIDCIFMK